MENETNVPRIIAMANMKGGVGKTTSTICTAIALNKLGRKVEVRDIDPQGSATLWAAKARAAGGPLPFDVRVANRFTVAMPPTVTTPGPLDLDRMWETAKAIDRPSSVLLTQTRANTVALRDAERFLSDHGLARFDATIPFKEALRRSSESGRMPSASGYGLVANELIEAFNGIE